ncbi:MAG: glycosyltransferase family 4 protein [Calditrichaeota bacterium]|nr:glycosyltransferase family 4 protein [Calditrichota bacterium]
MTAAPLKICIFTETYYPVMGGGETQARALAGKLVESGNPVIILTRRSDPVFAKVEQYGDVTVHRLPPTGSSHGKKWGLLFSAIPALFRLRRDYDVILVSGFRVVGMTAVLVSKLLGKACILKADSLGEMSGDFFRAGMAKMKLSTTSVFFRLFLGWRNRILKKADAFAAISSPVAAELRANRVDPRQIHMIPNSVDPQLFIPISPEEKPALRQQLGLPREGRLVVYTGRLVSYKGLPLLLEVWQKIAPIYPDATLLLVGEGGLDMHNCEAELRAFADGHNLQQRVLFTGKVQHVQAYLQASDIFVFPTEREAFGISLIEAMACGLAVIATAAGGIPDILQDRQNGLMINAGAADPLAAALGKLLDDPALAATLGRAARRTVLEKYSEAMVTGQYLALFRELVLSGEQFH